MKEQKMSYKTKIIIGLAGLQVSAVLLIIYEPSWPKSDPAFCSWCHKKNLHQRKFRTTQATPPVVLAGPHWQKGVWCQRCHRGIDFYGKALIRYEEVKNTGKYVLGWFAEPTSLTHAFPDINCRVCHRQYQPVSKFHNLSAHGGKFPRRCAECHSVHKKGGGPGKYFLIKTKVIPVCNKCHPNWIEKLDPFFEKGLRNRSLNFN